MNLQKKDKFPVDEFHYIIFFNLFLLFDSQKGQNICRAQSKYTQFWSRKSKYNSSTF